MAVMPSIDVTVSFQRAIPLSALIAIWDALAVHPDFVLIDSSCGPDGAGPVAFCDFTAAVEKAGIKVVNDIDQNQPGS